MERRSLEAASAMALIHWGFAAVLPSAPYVRSTGRYRTHPMPTISQSALTNGLPLYRIAVDGTRAVTILVAFDAGARTERPEENGMAHFLEHLVFKGGEKYPTYRDVNEAAESIGAVLNAYTSHDLVAFHITARAERALEAADLLTDFVGRPRINADELDRERGVVVQEIARANDQPSVMAEHLIDEAAFGDHPLGRPVLGPAEHIRDTFTRDGIVAFRSRRWAPSRGGAFVVGNLSALGENGTLDELFSRFPTQPEPDPYEPAPAAEPRVLVQRARLQPVAPADVLPARDRHLRSRASGRRWRSTRRCWAARWARACSTRSASSAAWPTRCTRSPTPTPTSPILQLSAGLESGKLLDAYRRMREIVTELREQGPTEAEVERARAYAAGARAIAFENTGAVARYAAQQTIVYGEDVDPDATIALLDQVTFAEVARSPPTLLTSCRSLAWVRTPWRNWRPPDTLGRPVRRRRDRSGWVRRIRRRVRDRVRSRRREPAGAVDERVARRVERIRKGPLARPARPASDSRRAGAAEPAAGPPAGARCARRWHKAGPDVRGARLRPDRQAARCSRCATTSAARPASVEKLYTTLARSAACSGPSARLHTAVLGTGHLGRHGVWHGDLYLVGGGDPTFGDGALQPRSGSTATAPPPRSSSTSWPRTGSRGHRPGDRRRVAVRPPPRRAAHQPRARRPGLRRAAQRADLRPRRDHQGPRPGGVRRP